MSNDILNKIVDKLDSLDNKVTGLDNKVTGLEKQLDTVAIEVFDIKEQLKDKPGRGEVSEQFNLALGNIDRFVKLHEILDTELAALRSKHSRLEERLVVVEQKLQTA